MPTAYLVVIGSEILSGKVVDTNTPHLAGVLRERGVRLVGVEVVPDEPARIVDAVRRGLACAERVFTSGGVGPTHDDVALRAVAAALERPLVRHAGLAQRISDHYGPRVNAALLSMADLPEGVELIDGGDLWMPVMSVARVVILPGVPELFRRKLAVFAPRLSGPAIALRRLFLSCDEGEIAELLGNAQREHASVEIGSYPRIDDGAGYRVLVTLESTDAGHLARCVQRVLDGLPAGALLRTDAS